MWAHLTAKGNTEVASRIPERIASLSLVVTKAGRRRLVDLPSVSYSSNSERSLTLYVVRWTTQSPSDDDNS